MRISNKSEMFFISAFLVIAFALSVAAVGQSSSSPANDQASPPTQAAPAQTAPTPQQPPAGSQGSAPAPQTGAQQNSASSIDDELQLTEDQKQKIAAVVDDENKQISAVRDDNSMNLQQKQQKVVQIRQAGTPKIKAILTPEQLQKLAAIQQRMREQQGNTQAQPQPQNPQR